MTLKAVIFIKNISFKIILSEMYETLLFFFAHCFNVYMHIRLRIMYITYKVTYVHKIVETAWKKKLKSYGFLHMKTDISHVISR